MEKVSNSGRNGNTKIAAPFWFKRANQHSRKLGDSSKREKTIVQELSKRAKQVNWHWCLKICVLENWPYRECALKEILPLLILSASCRSRWSPCYGKSLYVAPRKRRITLYTFAVPSSKLMFERSILKKDTLGWATSVITSEPSVKRLPWSSC